MSTFVLIEKYTVGAGGASSVTLGSGGTIPQTYTDLKILATVRTNRTGYVGDNMTPIFNGSTANFTFKALTGGGTSAYSDSTYIPAFDTNVATSNTFSNLEITIPNYTSSNYKSISIDAVTETNASIAYMTLTAGLWSQTAAITSFGLQSSTSSTIQQYSTFYLYGILKA